MFSKEQVLNRLSQLITPTPIQLFDLDAVTDFSDFGDTPVIKQWYNETWYNEHAIIRVWKDFSSGTGEGILTVETYDRDADELNTDNLEEIAALDELLMLEEVLTHLHQ